MTVGARGRSLPETMRPLLIVLLLLCSPYALVQAQQWTAAQIADAMAELVEDGDSVARIKMTSPEAGVLQIRIKSRRSGGELATMYEILWPKERKGEAFILRESRNGAVRTSDGTISKLGADEMSKPVFGTALAYADVLENFFRWDKQTLDGTGTIGKTLCIILESSPGEGDVTVYGKVRSWIDPRRMVSMRIEKYNQAGAVVRRIETTQVAKDDRGKNVPAGMKVVAGDNSTDIDGTNIRHDVNHSDEDFSF